MKNYLQLILSLFIISSTPFLASSQLDSTNISLQVENYTYLNEENDSIVGKCIKVDTWINDFDFFGEILVTAYDVETNFPVQMLKYTKVQVENDEMINDNIITTRIYNSIEFGRSYRVDVQVRNYQGMNLVLNSDTLIIN